MSEENKKVAIAFYEKAMQGSAMRLRSQRNYRLIS